MVVLAMDVSDHVNRVDVIRAGEAKLRFAVSVAEMGVWELDLQTGRAWREPRHDQIFGYDPPLPEWSYEAYG